MYAAPLADIKATLEQMIEAGRLSQTELFADATPETVEAVVAEAAKLAESAMAPINHSGDQEGSRLENGVVRTPTGYKEAYAQIAEGGWVGMAADPEHGGMGLPITVMSAVNEMMASANLSLSLCPLLSQGAIEALEKHGTPEQKALYLPKLISGEWNGAMNLTEPQAGSDVGALRTKAEPVGDGSYRIEGGKIWISWGDNDCASSTVHLVLARLPGAPAGSRGISLFVVPKFLPNADGGLGERNALKVVSLDHKMGLHGSPTCVMAYEGATGWLVGEENKGLACMFTMMNNARLGVGIEGVGIAEMATQKAMAFAMERRQGKTPTQDGQGTIVEFADVRRMLMDMASLTQAARAIAYACAFQLDMARAAPTAEARADAAAMGAFLTPLAKAFGTDVGIEVAQLGVQVHGGMGFIEETGAAQYSRDVRVTAIYEGTNGIQAMDLVGRKLADGGAAAERALGAAAELATAMAAGAAALQGPAMALAEAVGAARETTRWMLEAAPNDRAAGGVDYLRLLSLTFGGMYLLRAAKGGDPRRVALARSFAARRLPEVKALAVRATQGAEDLYALDAQTLSTVS
ncbi:MAG: acyl-CoA dehydrogenase [Neomegalonema sp.]|nr:acyl-CoA dehydrogenase [Neomegalonema sp.]